MDTMVLARLTVAGPPPAAAPQLTLEPRACRVRLTPGPIAAVQARRQVEAEIVAWDVPVDADVAILLTSDLVTHAVRHAPGGAVTLSIRCTRDCLRVDVHDSARPSFMPARVPTGARPGPGLVLVARLATDWGCYQTAAGKAVYFSLAFPPD
jgi:hypothetical protein